MVAIPAFHRDFSPAFIIKLTKLENVSIVLEKDYGTDLNYLTKNYIRKNVSFLSREKLLKSADMIVVLTAPNLEDIKLMKRGSILVSMLHVETHPGRNALMKKLGIKPISLDGLQDTEGRRIIQDLKNTAWQGVTQAYKQLYKKMGQKWWFSPTREPISIMVLGFGEVGKYATEAAIKMGRTKLLRQLIQRKSNSTVNIYPFVSSHAADLKIYSKAIISKSLFDGGKPHIVIDATKRADYSKHILSEDIITKLPKECVILDLSADKYEDNKTLKGIQGIPTGSEKKQVFMPQDSAWEDEKQVPKKYQLPIESRRTVISHYAWPSCGTVADRRRSMEKYGTQIYPVIISLWPFTK